MSESTPRRPVSPDDALPPVQPPSAGFLVQLFLIPGIIVAIICVIFFGVKLLTPASDPAEAIKRLRSGGEGRWQAAVNLASALRNQQNEPLRRDPKLAAELGTILKDEIADASMEERAINLRVYLCLAIGQFRTAGGLDSLLLAAKTERDPKEAAVRLTALKAIADLTLNMREAGEELTDPRVLETLQTASRDAAPPLRAAAALALSTLGTDAAQSRLRQMLGDDAAAVRYDTALALAKRGDMAALDTLLEMLAADQSAALGGLKEGERIEKQKLIQASGLRGIRQLAEQNPTADLSAADIAVAAMTKADLFEVRSEALAAQQAMAKRITPEARPE